MHPSAATSDEALARLAQVDYEPEPIKSAEQARKKSDWREFIAEIDSTDKRSQGGNTPLHDASQIGDVRRATSLISSGTNIEAINYYEQTPLHLAAWHGESEIVRALLDAQANTTAKSISGKTPLHMAAWMGHPNAARLIVQQNRSTIHARDKTGESPLHWAAWRGKVRTIDELLNLGADIEVLDHFDMTPLLLAAQGGKHRAIGKLLDRVADIYAADKDGESALHWAADKGYSKASVELLGRGALVDAVDKRKRTPLHLASQAGHTPVVQELVKRGADMGATERRGMTPLHLSALGGHIEVTRWLLYHGADLHTKDEDGMTPLHLAAWAGSRPVVEDLLVHGAHVEEKCVAARNTAMHLAARGNHLGAMVALLLKGAYPEAKNKYDSTPLHVGAKHGHLAVVCALLEEDIDISPVDLDGNTPLDLALQGDHQDVVAVLLGRGAKSNKGSTRPKNSRVPPISPMRRPAPLVSRGIGTSSDEPPRPRSKSPPRHSRSPSPDRPSRVSRGTSPSPPGQQRRQRISVSPSRPRRHPGVAYQGGARQNRSRSPRRASPGCIRLSSYHAHPGAPNSEGSFGPTWASGLARALMRGLPYYTMAQLEHATDNFSLGRLLGESDDGVTYQGELDDGVPCAIRVLNPYVPEVAHRFNHQVMVTAAVPHENIATVIGVCPEEHAIVYQYMPGGSLRQRMEDSTNEVVPLTWKDRMLLAYQIAEGVNHLHTCCPEPILHCNIVPSSILLDDRLRVKLAGVSKACLASEAHTILQSGDSSRIHVVAPIGAATDGQSAEGDVTCLGLLLLRLLTGTDESESPQELLQLVEEAMAEERLLKVADVQAGNWPHQALTGFVELAISCIRATAFGPELGTHVVPKLKRMAEIYATALPTVDARSGTAYSVNIHPRPEPEEGEQEDEYIEATLRPGFRDRAV